MTAPRLQCCLALAGLVLAAASAPAQSGQTTPRAQSENTETLRLSAPSSNGEARVTSNGEPVEEAGFGIDDLGAGFRWISPASIKNGSGDVSLTRLGAELSFEYELPSGVEFSVGGEYFREDWSYDGQGSGLLVGLNRPWDGFERYGFEVGAGVPVGDWQIVAELGFEWAEEISASTSDSLLLEGFVAGRRQIRDNLDIVLGVFYGESLEEDDDILPLIGIEWRITDRDTLSLSRPREGYQLEYRRALNDAWTARTYARFVNEEFRLDRNGPTNGGALSSEEFQLGIGIDYRLGPGRAGLDVGYSFGRDYEVFDGNGRTLLEPELDSAVSIGIHYSIGF